MLFSARLGAGFLVRSRTVALLRTIGALLNAASSQSRNHLQSVSPKISCRSATACVRNAKVMKQRLLDSCPVHIVYKVHKSAERTVRNECSEGPHANSRARRQRD